MSHDAYILAQKSLPARPGGWRHTPDAPLWFAAVHVGVYPVEGRAFLQSFVDAQGGAVEVIALNYRASAAEFAARYVDVLRRATGGAVVVDQTLRHPCVAARPMSREALDRALLRADLEELRAEPELRASWRTRGASPDPYEDDPAQDEAEAPVGSVWTVLCPVAPGPLGLPESPWIQPTVYDFVAWARRDTLRAAYLLGDRAVEVEYVAAVEVVVHDGSIARSEERALHAALRALAERTGGVQLARWD